MLLTMKRVAGLWIVAGVSFSLGTCYAMTLEDMQALRGADLLELRVAEIFNRCGLPDVVVDREANSSTKKDIQWNNTGMKLSDGHWDLLYGAGSDTGTKNLVDGWINPNPTGSRCFLDVSRATLFAQGRAGVLTIDKERHKTTYAIPESLFQAHKVIGLEVSLRAPLPFVEVVRTYGRAYETVAKNESSRIARYWVVVESSQMPVALYAVDFEINNSDDTCVAYRVATSEYDSVRRKLQELMRAWEKYGID